MENQIIYFLTFLWGTFIITRILSHSFHDYKNYGTNKEKSRTITGYLRKITGRDIHHIHLGLSLLTITVLLLFIFGTKVCLIIILGISLSLIADQIVPLTNSKKNYFSKERIIEATIMHVIISLLALSLSFFEFRN